MERPRRYLNKSATAQTGSAQIDFSQTGTLIYGSGEVGGGLLTVQWLDAAGKTQPLLAKPDSYQRPSLSPDGTRLAINTIGHLGLRMAARHDDALDVRARTFHLSNLEPRRPVHPVLSRWEACFGPAPMGQESPSP